jgi:hypothetical protein
MVDEENEIPMLPTITGAAAAVAKSGPVRDLFSPAAKVFGKYWGHRASEITARWHQQQEENLRDHQRRVEEVIGPPKQRPVSKKQIDEINEWTERAEDVPLDDKESAALWQSLLAEIYSKSQDVQERLTMIKQLTPSDAKLLLNAEFRDIFQSAENRQQLDHLVQLGILSKNSILDINRRRVGSTTVLVLYLTIFVAVAFVANDLGEVFALRPSMTSLIKASAIVCVSFLLAFSLSVILRDIGRYTFTTIGHSIRDSALRFYERNASELRANKTGSGAGPDAGRMDHQQPPPTKSRRSTAAQSNKEAQPERPTAAK